MVELTDQAPVDLREPIRGLLWITGRLRPLNPVPARASAVSIAEIRPDPRLLDVGHEMTLLRLTPVSLVLADADGTHSLRPLTFSAASPDPFHNYETHSLRHLASDNWDVVDQLAKHLPQALRDGRIRPLGLDRYGLRPAVEADAGDHDVRLAFSRPVDPPAAARHRTAAGRRLPVPIPPKRGLPPLIDAALWGESAVKRVREGSLRSRSGPNCRW
jgi:hypothetical protein